MTRPTNTVHALGCHMIEVAAGEWQWLVRITCPEIHVPVLPVSSVAEQAVDNRQVEGSSPSPATTPGMREYGRRMHAMYERTWQRALVATFTDVAGAGNRTDIVKKIEPSFACSEWSWHSHEYHGGEVRVWNLRRRSVWSTRMIRGTKETKWTR